MTPKLRLAALLAAVATIPCRAGAASTDPVHHRLSARLSVANRSIQGSDHVRAHIDSTAPTFDLDPRLTVRRVRVAGKPVAFERRGGRWRVELGFTGEVELSIDYDGVLILDPRVESGSRSFVQPQGTLLIGAWYPRFDRGLVTYDLDATVEDGQIAVAPGALVEEEHHGEIYRARFASAHPIPEIPLFAGPFRVAEKAHGGISVRTYLHPEGAKLSELYLSKSADYLDRFQHTIGPYDFPHFYVVSSPMPVGFGFAGIAYLSRRIIPLPYVPGTSLGHEVLHSWWGIGVRVAADSGNWAEGLTTFQADYAAAEAVSAGEARDMRLRWLREYAVLPSERDVDLAAFRGREHNASQVVGYHKAAFVFLMLRDMIGADRFDAGLRDFWIGHRRSAAGWDDLRKSFEKHANRPLAGFFRQWVQRTGAPALAVRDARRERTSDGYRVRFTLAQDAPVYDIEIPIAIETASSRIGHTVTLKRSEEEYSLTVREEPVRLRVDPDLRVFRRLSAREVPAILREVAFDPEAATILAGGDGEMAQVAAQLAEAFFGRSPRFVTTREIDPKRALLIVGTPAAVGDLRKALGLLQAPSPPATGTSRVWALERPSGPAIAIAEGEPAALRQIVGPLPHYGAQSFVVFDGRRAVDKGLWQPSESPLNIDLRAVAQPDVRSAPTGLPTQARSRPN